MLPFDLGRLFITLLKQLIMVRFPYLLYRMFFSQGPSVFGLRPVVALFIAACLTLFDWNRAIEKIFNPFIQHEEVQKALVPEVAKITFHGNEHFHSIFLHNMMVTKPRPFFPPWSLGGRYHPPTMDADLLRLKKFYFDRGFLETSVRVEHFEEDSANNVVRIVIAIDEGSPTIVQAVQLTGTLPPELSTKPDILKRLPLQAGQRISKLAFDTSKALLLEPLVNAGYIRAHIAPQTEVDSEKHEAIITFTLYPGRAVSFGRILITGSAKVDESTIRHHLGIKEGERSSRQRITEGVERLDRLGKFRSIIPRILNFDEDDAPLDLEINVEEWLPSHGRIEIRLGTPSQIKALRGSPK